MTTLAPYCGKQTGERNPVMRQQGRQGEWRCGRCEQALKNSLEVWIHLGLYRSTDSHSLAFNMDYLRSSRGCKMADIIFICVEHGREVPA